MAAVRIGDFEVGLRFVGKPVAQSSASTAQVVMACAYKPAPHRLLPPEQATM